MFVENVFVHGTKHAKWTEFKISLFRSKREALHNESFLLKLVTAVAEPVRASCLCS